MSFWNLVPDSGRFTNNVDATAVQLICSTGSTDLANYMAVVDEITANDLPHIMPYVNTQTILIMRENVMTNALLLATLDLENQRFGMDSARRASFVHEKVTNALIDFQQKAKIAEEKLVIPNTNENISVGGFSNIVQNLQQNPVATEGRNLQQLGKTIEEEVKDSLAEHCLNLLNLTGNKTSFVDELPCKGVAISKPEGSTLLGLDNVDSKASPNAPLVDVARPIATSNS
ncbi:hypothetical protein ACA910_019716 [Epithemia clementina (nom. ined.)]